MKSLGISITRDHLAALLWEQSLFSSRLSFSCSVSCREPYGSPEDAARLAEEVRRQNGGKHLPPVVLSIPPSWTYLRQIELPVTDIERARKIHVSELEGNLPVEDEEILSDLLPSPPGQPGRFLAIAARRSTVEKAVAVFSGAGFPVDRVVTDHVSILSAILAREDRPQGFILSTLSDIVILQIEDGAILRARQFPAAMMSDREGLGREWELWIGDTASGRFLDVAVLGDVPAGLSPSLVSTPVLTIPPPLGESSLLAYGAALVPSFSKEIGGFSLRTSMEAESERSRERRRVRIAGVAGAVAVVSLVGSVEVARWTMEKKVALVRAQIRKEFSEAVPGVKVVVQETTQIREKIQSLRRHQKELGIDNPPLSSFLMKISQALPQKENIAVRELSYDAGRMRLSGDAGAAKLVETYRSSLSAAFGTEMTVTVQESQGSARPGNVRFTILIEKGGPGRAS